MVIYHSRIICTNRKCQAEFEQKLLEEKGKRDKIRQIKIDNDAKRFALKQKLQAEKKSALATS